MDIDFFQLMHQILVKMKPLESWAFPMKKEVNQTEVQNRNYYFSIVYLV